MELYQRIVIARKKKGLTQEQLADLTNVTVRTIQRIESGESIPRSYTVKAIAAVLNISFEELLANTNSNKASLTNSINSSISPNLQDGKHFLQMLCLSCFSYLVIPLVHFLVPARMLKKSNEQNPAIIAFARKVISNQIYWMVALYIFLLLSLAYNFIITVYFKNFYSLNYLWPFFIMYFINIIIITTAIWRIKKTDFTLEPPVQVAN